MNFYKSVIENIAHHAVDNPDKLCLADQKKALTYGSLTPEIVQSQMWLYFFSKF